MKNSYDKSTLYAYLLGLLPEEDIERLDELTFTNSDFAESVDVAESELVDAYVNGELSSKMLDVFESHYLASPRRRQKVEFARALQSVAAKQLAGEGGMISGAAESSGVRRGGKISGFFESFAARLTGRPAFAFASAALVFLLLGVGGWILIRAFNSANERRDVASATNQGSINAVNSFPNAITPSPANEIPAANSSEKTKPALSNSAVPQAVPKSPALKENRSLIATVTLFPPLRGGQKLVEVPIKPQTDFAAFSINLESADFAYYKIDLVDQSSGKFVWRSRSAKAHRKAGAASLSANVPAKLLPPSVYSFSISGISKDGTEQNIGDYPFRVVR